MRAGFVSDLVERTGVDGRSCLVARKRYLPRQVKEKGALEALGVQRASTFRHDVQYREGRQFRKSRDRRAVELGTTYGKRLMQDRWTGHEHEVMALARASPGWQLQLGRTGRKNAWPSAGALRGWVRVTQRTLEVHPLSTYAKRKVVAKASHVLTNSVG